MINFISNMLKKSIIFNLNRKNNIESIVNNYNKL